MPFRVLSLDGGDAWALIEVRTLIALFGKTQLVTKPTWKGTPTISFTPRRARSSAGRANRSSPVR